MKKTVRIISLLLAVIMAFASCGGDTQPPAANPNVGTGGTGAGSGNTGSSNTGTPVSDPITVDYINLGDDFNAEYYPAKEYITQREGVIDVVILLDGADKGWEALAAEYSRLHSGYVHVNINKNYSSGTYADALKNEISDPNTKWDIVQGNLVNSSALSQYCINMYTHVNGNNGYAGNKKWNTVIEEDAYITDKSGTNTSTYIMNSENLLTAFFVNSVALEAAGAKGYKNANGEVATPLTWNDLISLCAYMQEAGYENPLGLSLNRESITSYSFSWLLRVYGDYYFRNEYSDIMNNDEYVYDETLENPENDINYAINLTWLMHKILDENETGCGHEEGEEHYIGAKSDKFKDFISNIMKISPYIDNVAATTKTMEDMRNAFQTQSAGKASPQIVLDYSGMGLYFLANENDSFKLDYFDYPTMESDFVPSTTLTRDVGGNGGYLSIISHDKAQNELNLDFMKFVMSPYGQSIYYDALAEEDFAPKGLTLVKQDLVKVPENWEAFFKTDKISFTGLADTNEFVRNLVVSHGGQDISTEKVEYYQRLLVSQGSDSIDLNTFCQNWHNTLLSAWSKYAKAQGFSENCWVWPGNGNTYTGPAN